MNISETKVVNTKKQNCDVYIGRANGGKDHMMNTLPTKKGWLGNPYSLSEYSREQSIKKFKIDFKHKLKNDLYFRQEVKKLKGKILGCFCKPKSCHGDVIKEYLDSLEE